MKSPARLLALALCLVLALPPGWVAAAAGAVAATKGAPAAQVETLKRLSAKGPFSCLADFIRLEAPAEGDVTEALVKLYPLATEKEKARKAEAEGVTQEDWRDLLILVREKKESLRGKGLSAWTYEKRLESLSGGAPAAEPAAEPAEKAEATPPAAPTGVDRAELQVLQDGLKDLRASVKGLQDQMDRMKSEAALRQQTADESEKARSADRDAQREELRLVKNLVDGLGEGQKRLEAGVAAAQKKADAKGVDNEELKQTLAIMRKDVRDNVQDVSVLKQQVAKLEAPEKQYARPLDKALGSKWLPGAALLVALGAIVIAVTKK